MQILLNSLGALQELKKIIYNIVVFLQDRANFHILM